MLLSYEKARKANIKSPYIYNTPGFSFMCPIGSVAECPDHIAYQILNQDGDIIKEVKETIAPKKIRKKKEEIIRKQVLEYEVTDGSKG